MGCAAPRRRDTASVLGAALLWAALPAPDAAAQLMRNSAPRSIETPATRPPPAALPGLQGRRAPEPIPGDPTQSLPPNAALFDAINRGDLPAARDAVARGADTEARNVLGLTPVDAAVDQGRTEIMFYLLSVRGAPRIGGPPPEAEERRGGRSVAATEGAAADATSRLARRRWKRRRPSAARALWAGNGGAPNPAIGFLGFDAGRPAGAVPPPGAAPRRGRPEHSADGDGAGLRTAGRSRPAFRSCAPARECLAGSEVATLESRDMPQAVRSFPPAPPPPGFRPGCRSDRMRGSARARRIERTPW